MNLLVAAVAWLPSTDDLRLIGPELVLIGTIAIVLLLPLLAGRRPDVSAVTAVLGCLLALVATWAVAAEVADGPRDALSPPATGLPMILADRFAVFYRLLLLLTLGLIAWLWLIGVDAQRSRGLGGVSGPEFFVLLLTSALGMLLMVSSLNLLVLILAIETASLPSYALVASDRRSRLGAEAALKYVLFGAAASAITVYGVSLLYGHFGTLDLGRMAAQLAQNDGGRTAPVVWLALATFGVGIIFKIAAVPMHFWCPDVFQGAPIEVTTWLSVASKAAGLGLLLRLLHVFATPVAAISSGTDPGHTALMLAYVVGALAAVTCTVGNLAALRQDSVKRILAYSSIAHAGYMMMAGALCAAPVRATDGADPGLAALLSYLAVYLLMNVGAFGATALVVWQTGSDHLSAFTGLGRRAPWVAVPMAICLFSLVGLPPLGGFAAKWYLLLALGRAGSTHPWLWILVVVAVLNTAISLYYYVRIIRQMYLVDDPQLPALRPPVGGVAIVNACAVLLILLGTVAFNALGQRAATLASEVYTAPTRQPAPSVLTPTPVQVVGLVNGR